MKTVNHGSRSPWSKIVTGESTEPLSPEAVSLSSIQEKITNASTACYPSDSVSQAEGSDSDGGYAIKKPVWSKPLNDVVCWPALRESAKSGIKPSSSEAIGNSLSSVEKPGSVSPASSTNHIAHFGQRNMKRGGVNLSTNGRVSEAGSFDDTYGKADAFGMDFITKGHVYKGSPRVGVGSRQDTGNERHQQQNSYRRGNGGTYFRGGKLDQGQGQGRGNQEWNQSRNFNNRDGNLQSQRGGYRRGSYIRPIVHNSTLFVHHPVLPFGNNVLYPGADVASAMVYFQGPVPPMVPVPQYFPFPDPLHGTIVKQIEYYFSNENLVKDTYLRRNMDEHGWVPVNLIAGFKKVSCLTDNVSLILDVMRQSTIVEVQGEKMRRRNDWARWLMPPAVQDLLASQLQAIGLNSRPSSGELSSQLQQGGGERAAVA